MPAEPLKTDERDQRVKELLVMKTKEARIKKLYYWVMEGKVTCNDFTDLFRIVMRQVEFAEVTKDLRALVNKFGKASPDQGSELKTLKMIRDKLPGLTKKMEVSSGDE